jgi:glycosyltransferase involved in cell wall biosynthesis
LFISAGDEKIRKGAIYLEKALPSIFDKHDVNLIHVGAKFNWDLPEKYKNRILSTGTVKWEKMKDYYASSKIILVSALNEGIPNVILESMASGTPIVTSDINGIDEYIKHKMSGYIYKRGDVDGLIKGVGFMLENSKKASLMAAEAKKLAKKLDYPRFSAALLDFMEKIYKKEGEDINLLWE